MRVTQVEQKTCAQFAQTLANPTCFSLIKSEALAGQIALDCSPAILYPVLDRLLGGTNDQSQPPARPLTAIELRLATRVTNLMLEALCRAWEGLGPMDFELASIETTAAAWRDRVSQ